MTSALRRPPPRSCPLTFLSLRAIPRPSKSRPADISSRRVAQAPEEFYDLYRDVAEAYWAQGNERGALDLLSPLRAVPACDTPALWERIAACRIRLGDLAGAVAEYESAVQEHPGHPDALTALAKLLPGLVRRRGIWHSRCDETV